MSDGPLLGKFCIFRLKFIAFKTMLMCFISRSLALKIRIYISLLPGHPGQGLKIGILPEKSRH